MDGDFLFSSESVSDGHPDKIADQISDAILDAIIKLDPNSKIACECYVKTGLCLVGGEISTSAWVDIEEIARKTICEIGYDHSDLGYDGNSCAVINAIGKQSSDISAGIQANNIDEIRAGDQGLMFGYACNETESYMPIPIFLAHQLMLQHKQVRGKNNLNWLRPDAKCQVTIRYKDNIPYEVGTIVLSTQHSPDVDQQTIESEIIKHIIEPVVPKNLLKNTKFIINPTGRFVIGGPMGDCGLTGRKIIVDTYGGMARHGGGAFSGKDPSKVDRSANYYARYIAKNIVAAKLAKRCEIQLAYAIGVAEPVSLYINCFGTNIIPIPELQSLVKQNFDFRPANIIAELNLLRPIYQQTTCFGHFGRNEELFGWEQLDKVSLLSSLSKEVF